MENVTDVRYGTLPENSAYIKPLRMYFVQNGVEKNWDMVKVDNSVSVIIFNKTTNKLVCVKQFRPVTYYNVISQLGCKPNDDVDLVKYPASLGITLELCSGTVDKDLSLKEIAREEIVEKCGFNVALERVEEVMTYRSDVGASGPSETMFYCEVTDLDKVSDGGRVNDQIKEVIEISIQEAQQMVKTGANTVSPPNCLIGLLWFLRNKAPR